MKKSLIALAVLAASGAAMAQSSVTLYGIADVWFGSLKDETSATNTQRQTKLDSGGVNTSRWGLKGSEDLGGGLKANFQLEQGFSIDDGTAKSTSNLKGTTTGTAFARQAWVGLSGSFGAVKLGHTTTALDDINGASHAVFDSALSPHQIFRSDDFNARPSNVIHYATPNFSGFTAAVSYALGEDKDATNNASKSTAFNVRYAAGPLDVQLGYQSDDVNTNAQAAKFTVLGASYNFGVATLKGNYGMVDNLKGVANDDFKDWQLGVDVPVSSALTLSASYGKSTADLATSKDAKSFGIGAAYSLSKRTTVYGGLRADNYTLAGAADQDVRLFAVGINHKF